MFTFILKSMKKKLYFYLLVLFCIQGCTDKVVISSSDKEQSVIQVRSISRQPVFEFPNIQWASYDNHQQKLDACQIPDSLLSKIPTDELVKICMDYPMLLDAYAFNSIVQGMERVVSEFNGFTELQRREDNCLVLFEFLKNNDLKLNKSSNVNNAVIAKKTLCYALGEMLLSFDNVIINADDNLKKEIAIFSYNMLESKENDANHYALATMATSAYLCTKILSQYRLSTKSVGDFIDTFLVSGRVSDYSELQRIKEMCRINILK